MRTLIFTLSLVALTGCTAIMDAALEKPKAYVMEFPDGERGLHINCSGGMNTFADCYHKAAEECARYRNGDTRYVIVGRDSEERLHGGSSGQAYANQYGGYGSHNSHVGTSITRDLYVKCGPEAP